MALSQSQTAPHSQLRLYWRNVSSSAWLGGAGTALRDPETFHQRRPNKVSAQELELIENPVLRSTKFRKADMIAKAGPEKKSMVKFNRDSDRMRTFLTTDSPVKGRANVLMNCFSAQSFESPTKRRETSNPLSTERLLKSTPHWAMSLKK